MWRRYQRFVRAPADHAPNSQCRSLSPFAGKQRNVKGRSLSHLVAGQTLSNRRGDAVHVLITVLRARARALPSATGDICVDVNQQPLPHNGNAIPPIIII